MKRLTILRSIMIGLFSLALVGAGWFAIPAAEAGPIEIKFAHVDTADIFTSKKEAAAAAFKNIVEAETAGQVEVKVFPAGQLGGEGGPSHYRRLLDGHWHQDVAPVDGKIDGDAQRQAVQADHVLDHSISSRHIDPHRAAQDCGLVLGQFCPLGDPFHALFERQVVESS